MAAIDIAEIEPARQLWRGGTREAAGSKLAAELGASAGQARRAGA